MKKTVILLLTVVMLALGLTMVYAATEVTNYVFSDPNSSATNIIFHASTNVRIFMATDANGVGYAIVSGHDQGDKMFGAASNSTKIYWNSKVIGTAVVSGDCSGTDSGMFTGTWSAL